MRKQIKPLRCYWPQYLRGFVCAHHPAAPAPGLNPKHTIYAFLKKRCYWLSNMPITPQIKEMESKVNRKHFNCKHLRKLLFNSF